MNNEPNDKERRTTTSPAEILRLARLAEELEKANHYLEEVEAALERLLPMYRELDAYYTNGAWMYDYDHFEEGNFPPSPLFSEDYLYDVIGTNYMQRLRLAKLFLASIDTP